MGTVISSKMALIFILHARTEEVLTGGNLLIIMIIVTLAKYRPQGLKTKDLKTAAWLLFWIVNTKGIVHYGGKLLNNNKDLLG